MSLAEADQIVASVRGMGGEYVSRSRGRGGSWRVTVRMEGEPPRTYARYRAAFEAYCKA
jgi:hypothetical protein